MTQKKTDFMQYVKLYSS